jgi:hypothetical protein
MEPRDRGGERSFSWGDLAYLAWLVGIGFLAPAIGDMSGFVSGAVGALGFVSIMSFAVWRRKSYLRGEATRLEHLLFGNRGKGQNTS